MPNPTPFKILNASAGSGKTYSLVKEYLKILLASDNTYQFQQMLAITFTNKAVGEMKERIIETLKSFSKESIITEPNDMFSDLVRELSSTPEKIHEKSKKILEVIIQNYSAFNVSTIDRFTHKILQTFAHDLKLPGNFEVELDTESLLKQAVDNLISKTGKDIELTKVLVDFALEKTDEDKSWDISHDLNNVASLFVNENHISHLDKLESKSFKDFSVLKQNIYKKIKTLEQKVIKKARSVLTLIAESGLKYSDFSRQTLPNHFKRIISLNFYKIYDNQLQNNLAEKKHIYNKSTDKDIADTIESILPQIETKYLKIKNLVFQYLFLKNIYKNITPLSVLNAINSELNLIKDEQNLLLISEFNSIISKEIKNQPIPFIYERIGEKFKHYFIDEFQDTSELQWYNLNPLIENTLSAEGGTTLLVGDAKQAIYRWRGGKAEQFINLFNENDKPFTVKQDVHNLPANYRSSKHIVEFNNNFFKYLSSTVFADPEYAKIYSESDQELQNEIEGYVDIKLLDYSKSDDKDDVYVKEVLKTINQIIQNGYQLKDICVLVRKKLEGIAIADALSQEGIDIISSETLLINRSPKVKFILNMLKLAIQPYQNETKLDILNFVADNNNIEDKHGFFLNYKDIPIGSLFEELNGFDFNDFLQLSIYDAVERLIQVFDFSKNADAYLQFFLDGVHNYSLKYQSDIAGFIEYWETKKDDLSIVNTEDQNAVRIMTIHKSKGLEFPIVIFPYAELDIYKEKESKSWFAVDENEYCGFDEVYINLNKDLEPLNNFGQIVYNDHRSKLELDNINLLYVTLTRPIEQLYIIGKKDLDRNGQGNSKTYSGLIINYLKKLSEWDDSKLHYNFGNQKIKSKSKPDETLPVIQDMFISTPPESHNIQLLSKSGYLWDTSQKDSIEKGNLIHEVLAGIKTKSDIDYTLENFLNWGTIDEDQKIQLKNTINDITNHTKLIEYFSGKYESFNERDIYSKSQQILRPDKVIFKPDNKVVILDYKTGKQEKSHCTQLNIYSSALRELGFTTERKILVYINENLSIVEC